MRIDATKPTTRIRPVNSHDRAQLPSRSRRRWGGVGGVSEMGNWTTADMRTSRRHEFNRNNFLSNDKARWLSNQDFGGEVASHQGAAQGRLAHVSSWRRAPARRRAHGERG